MAWNSVITNVGATVLAQYAAGTALSVTRAAAATGRAAVTDLRSQTALTGASHTISITGSQTVTGGVKFNLLITPESSAYVIAQIGVFGTPSGGSETLLALYQAEEGSEIAVPASSDMPDFAYSFGATVMMDNTGTLTVTIDTTALVTQAQMAAAEGRLDDLETDVGTLQTDVPALDARVADLEAQGDPVTIAHGGTGATTAKAARQALGAAPTFTLGSATNSWAALYNTLSTNIPIQRSALVYITDLNVTDLLTGGKFSQMCQGTVTRAADGVYEFDMRRLSSGECYMWRVSGLTSETATPTIGTVYQITGSAVP